MMTSITFELRGDLMKPGIKPLLWRLVLGCGLGGWVSENDKHDAIYLRLEGDESNIRTFIRSISGTGKLYPAYKVRSITAMDKGDLPDDFTPKGCKVYHAEDFEMPSVRPDVQPCDDCKKEVMDPQSRRYGYPFFSCEKSGPGYSAALRTPFVRKNTSLSMFPPCHLCRDEINMARPKGHFSQSALLSCPTCGPHLFLLDEEGEMMSDERCIGKVREKLADGKIVAIQSLYGGFQLAVDAKNAAAICTVRARKKLPGRPIMIIARNMDAVHDICSCSPEEEKLLQSPEAPAVIMDVKESAGDFLALEMLSPDGPRLGVSLPSSLSMQLLFEPLPDEKDAPELKYLAVFSSNWGSSPVYEYGFDEMMCALKGVPDVYLCHDLRVGMTTPISVAVIRDGAPQIWRRSRGYVPNAVSFEDRLSRSVVSFGMDENAAIAIAEGHKIIPSQHLGDIQSADDARRLSQMIEHFTTLFDSAPEAVACDMNDRLKSSIEAANFAKRYSLPLIKVQSHHAMTLSGMADNHLSRTVSVVMSNGELGLDGNYWGAEVFFAGVRNIRRLGTFKPVKMHGNEHALVRPARQLFSRMHQNGIAMTPALRDRLHITDAEMEEWTHDAEEGKARCITTHAAIRLFDSFAAGLCVAPVNTQYRGQNAYCLEYAAKRAVGGIQAIPQWMYEKLAFNSMEDDSGKMVIDWTPLYQNLADPFWIKPDDIPYIALAFHVKIADAVACMVHYAAASTCLNDVLLTGPLFMNGVLLDLVTGKLRSEHYNVHIHRSIPMDESGVCIGQAWKAAD